MLWSFSMPINHRRGSTTMSVSLSLLFLVTFDILLIDYVFFFQSKSVISDEQLIHYTHLTPYSNKCVLPHMRASKNWVHFQRKILQFGKSIFADWFPEALYSFAKKRKFYINWCTVIVSRRFLFDFLVPENLDSMLLKLCGLILPSVHFSRLNDCLILRTSLQRKIFTALCCAIHRNELYTGISNAG